MAFEVLREQIVDKYYASRSVQFGQFSLSIHRDHPELPLSPWYMHYPKPGEPGSEYLPELYELIGQAFYELCEAQDTPIRPKKLAGLPNAGTQLALSHANLYADPTHMVVKFDKFEHPDKTTRFINPRGTWNFGDSMATEDDHISSARNNGLFIASARRLGFEVTHTLAVVDRQQGGAENLQKLGVGLLAIMTAGELLQCGVDNGDVRVADMERALEYDQSISLLLAA